MRHSANRPNENAPDAGQGIEGNDESANQEVGDSAMQSIPTRSNPTHLVSKWHVWVADELDVQVPAFCGVTQRHWDVNAPETDHELSGSAPAKMCPACLDVYDVLIRARDEREADAHRVLLRDEDKIRADVDIREAL